MISDWDDAYANAPHIPDGAAYPFEVSQDEEGMIRLGSAPMWRAMLADLASGMPAAVISARFHKGLGIAVARLAVDLLRMHASERIVALSGGSFQNRLLLDELERRLEADGVTVLIHAKVPASDGGLALGQAAVAAARRVAGHDGN